MTSRTRVVVSMVSVLLLSDLALPPADASTLTSRQQLVQQLQTESNKTQQEIEKNTQASQAITSKIEDYQSVVDHLAGEITSNEAQRVRMKQQLDRLNQQIRGTQLELARDEQNLQSMLRALYEDGNVSYLEVLFKATSWDDFLGRFESIATVTKAQDDFVRKVVALHRTLATQRASQAAADRALQDKTAELESLKQLNTALQDEQKRRLQSVRKQLETASRKRDDLQNQIQLTESEMAQFGHQLSASEAVLSTDAPAVQETELRYHAISPQSLWQYVKSHGSTFSLDDITTICSAAKRYDVSASLLVAITGQEQGFVPDGPDASLIRNNPFNVFYSWQVYNTSLADAANIAANTLRHKLSASPPAGMDAILWINNPQNPWGIYAEDVTWGYGLRRIYQDIQHSLSI